jgi:lactate dehydrogenase-like 2-hydroxyacid dehydrogenase
MQMEVQSRTSKGSHRSDARDRRYGLNWKGVYPCDELRANIDGEQYLAKKASVFNLKIAYHNRTRLSEAEEMAHNATYCSSLHELLSVSDIVSINCPLNAKTENLISEPEFAAMKDGAFFVNTARGAIVNEAALKQAIDSGKICRAGVDVLCNEPNVDPWFFEQDNVIVQPHLGGLTDVAFQKAERECFENVKAFFEKGKANSPVNTTK